MCYSKLLADAPSQVAATTCTLCFKNCNNLPKKWEYLTGCASLVEILAKINLTGLTSLRSKKNSTWHAIAYVS